MPDRLRVAYFDAGGTILTVRPSVGDIYSRVAASLGHPVDPAEVNARFRDAWKSSRARRREADYECSDEILRREWERIVLDSFRGLVPESVGRLAFEDLYERFSRADAWQLAEGTLETFRVLHRRGLRLGILSNWDSRLLETLVELGIDGFFDFTVISYEVGVEKPHPRIFETAAKRACVRPSQILFVGDSLAGDILPARAMGFQTVWVQGDGSEAINLDETGISVKSFGDVLAAVEGAFDLT